MKPWRAVDALNGGVEAQNRAMEGLQTNGPLIRITIVRSRIRIRILINVKSQIRIPTGSASKYKFGSGSRDLRQSHVIRNTS
jgi:hypothetical protein